MQTGDETAVKRLEAFIQYAVLTRKGPIKAVSAGAVSGFREHFPGACRDIAQVATQRLAERERITAPLDVNDGTPNVDTDCIDVPHAADTSTPSSAQDDVSDTSTPTVGDEVQGEVTEAVCHDQMLAEYTESFTTLTRKMNTITRLHAREKAQLRGKIKDLEKAVTSASRDIVKSKKEITKAQDRSRAAQDKVKKVQQQRKRAQEKATEAEAELQKAQEQAATSEEELRLRAEVQRLEQLLANETAKAKEDAEKAKTQRSAAHRICAKQQNEIEDLRRKLEAMSKNQIGQALEPEDDWKAKSEQERERLKEHIQHLEQTVMAKIKRTSDAEESLKEAQAESAKAREVAEIAKAQHVATTRICASAQNETATWKCKHDNLAASYQQMLKTGMGWESEYKKLRASLDTVLACPSTSGGQFGGQMGNLISTPQGAQAGSQDQAQSGSQWTQIMPKPN
jgi:hypothetical protein